MSAVRSLFGVNRTSQPNSAAFDPIETLSVSEVGCHFNSRTKFEVVDFTRWAAGTCLQATNATAREAMTHLEGQSSGTRGRGCHTQSIKMYY